MSMAAAVQLIRFGPFALDLQSGELVRNGRRLRLQGQSFQILRLLLERPGQVVTREELRQALWPGDTFVDFDSGLNNAVKRLREALGDTAAKPSFIETIPRRGYRVVPAVRVEVMPGPEEPSVAVMERAEPSDAGAAAVHGLPPEAAAGIQPTGLRWRKRGVSVAAVLLLSALGLFSLRPAKVQTLSAKDTIVLGDFTNKTGDPVFDETLRRGVAIGLEQSPVFSLVSENRVRNVLRLMNKPTDTPLTPAVTREICERDASTAYVDGNIGALGTQYVLWLRATNCATGEVIAEEQVRAARREDVLGALDAVVRRMRSRVGESVGSIERHKKPLAEATTSSLEALRAYSLGVKVFYSGDPSLAIPLFRHATELDPEFAAAWAYMACSCSVQPDVARVNITRAYLLRARATEREKLFIESTYFELGTGELEKAIATDELWAQLYPRDFEPQKSLALDYLWIGKPEMAIAWARKALPLEDDPLVYLFLAKGYLDLNDLQGAQAVYREMDRRRLETHFAVPERYKLAFLSKDDAGMKAWAAEGAHTRHAEDSTMAAEANTALWFGQMERARQLSRQASDLARRNNEIESAAKYQAYEALSEAEAGEMVRARSEIDAALKMSPSLAVRQIAPLVLATVGDAAAADRMSVELEKRDPVGTLTRGYYLPVAKAAIALQEKDPQRALENLRSVEPLDFALPNMMAASLRGEAFLRVGKGDLAAAEYQKILDHWGRVRNSPEGALARLGLARAYAMQGDDARAVQAYSGFLALWKSADAANPALIQAKQEAQRLQRGSALHAVPLRSAEPNQRP